MENDRYLVWFLLLVFASALTVLLASNKNRLVREKILELLRREAISTKDLWLRLNNREKIPLPKWRFNWIMNNLAWNQRITRNESGKWVIPFERPPLTAMLKRSSSELKSITNAPHTK